MKPELRLRAREILRAIPAEERERAGAAVAERVWSIPQISAARTLLVYAAVPPELPTASIAAEAIRRGVTLLYPRSIPSGRLLSLHVVTRPEEQLSPGRFGIPEPAEHCPALPLADLDAALVPGLLWDRSGARLGRGAGYFDRLFADPAWSGFACGIFYAAQEAARIPTDPWDEPLDAVVTEREVWTGSREVRPRPADTPPVREETD